ncbi:hypothetical protein D779_0552 [Imhoffiella purpurea]|uniref:Uncharacterized protein n=1 Tax=Imhoffiella purpurea TaxID=1249627 RepID=W9V8Y9_9GAMM|nr:hypothetical protein D779_0552 [Imhoffiella purpurea]
MLDRSSAVESDGAFRGLQREIFEMRLWRHVRFPGERQARGRIDENAS